MWTVLARGKHAFKSENRSSQPQGIVNAVVSASPLLLAGPKLRSLLIE